MDNMDKIQSFTDLVAWREAHKLVLMIYQLTKRFPREEQFGLTNQIRRASVSISSNIAEGFSRRSQDEKNRFYFIAQGSTTEVQNQLLIARDVGYIDSETFKEAAEQTVKVHKLVNGLIKSSRSKILHT